MPSRFAVHHSSDAIGQIQQIRNLILSTGLVGNAVRQVVQLSAGTSTSVS